MDSVTHEINFRPECPKVYGPLDYRNFRDTLIKIDEILRTGIEDQLVSGALKQCMRDEQNNSDKVCNSQKTEFHHNHLRYALRCNIARHLTGESYRSFSVTLADSKLFDWFIGICAFGYRKAVSKSSLERYEHYFDEEVIREKLCEWLSNLSNADKALEIGLNEPIDFSTLYMDSTCVKANIHFPVDWVLFRDAARSLILAITTIRKQGLKHRMDEPSILMKKMNKLCIAMTHTRRKKDGRKQRKKILRDMKKLVTCIRKHGERYKELLIKQQAKTNWSKAQVEQVLKRIDNILDQLPAAIHQAHERIIGERTVPANKKILSLYDHNAQIIVRGKAGNEVEFGQGFLLTEQKNGLIIDWELFEKIPPADNKAFEPALKRIKKQYGSIKAMCADRGFGCKHNDSLLKEQQIYNAVCPKNVEQLQEKLLDPLFVSLQTRRSQTEARIGIFKNVFLGRPLRTKIISNKRLAATWSVMIHNLWILARMAIIHEKSKANKAA